MCWYWRWTTPESLATIVRRPAKKICVFERTLFFFFWGGDTLTKTKHTRQGAFIKTQAVTPSLTAPRQAYQTRLWAHSVGARQLAWASCDLESACRAKPKVWRHVQSLLQRWCPQQVGSKKSKHFSLVSKRTAGLRLNGPKADFFSRHQLFAALGGGGGTPPSVGLWVMFQPEWS